MLKNVYILGIVVEYFLTPFKCSFIIFCSKRLQKLLFEYKIYNDHTIDYYKQHCIFYGEKNGTEFSNY